MNLIVAELAALILGCAGFLGYRQYRLTVHRRSRTEVHNLRNDLNAAMLLVQEREGEVNELLAAAGQPARYPTTTF